MHSWNVGFITHFHLKGRSERLCELCCRSWNCAKHQLSVHCTSSWSYFHCTYRTWRARTQGWIKMPETWEKCCIEYQKEKIISQICLWELWPYTASEMRLVFLYFPDRYFWDHFTSLLSHYLFPDQEMRPQCESVQFLSLGCWMLKLSHWLKHSRIFCFMFLVRAKGRGNSFWAAGLGCCQLRWCSVSAFWNAYWYYIELKYSNSAGMNVC